MTKKIIPFELNLKSSQRVGYTFKARPQILTNDANSAELNFIITDTSSEELTNSTATVLLFMRDGSFFQNTDVTRVNNTFIYTIKPNQAKHSGVAQAQLVVKIGTVENASQLVEFEIVGGLETKPIVEREIQDWTSLTAEAKAFVDQIEDFTLAEFVENKMGEELANLEVNYAGRLTGLESADQTITAQLAQKVGGGKKAELEDLSPTVLSAIEGGEGTSFDLLSIPQDGSVSVKKTTFAQMGKNKFSGQFIENVALLGSAPMKFQSYAGGVCAIAEIKPNQAYTISKATNTDRFAVGTSATYPNLNDEVNFIVSNTTLTQYTFTTGSDVSFVIIYLDNANTIPAFLQVEEGTNATDFVGYDQVKLNLSDDSILIPDITPEMTTFAKKGKNLFSGNFLDNHFLSNPAEGLILSTSSTGGKVAIFKGEKGKTYTLSRSLDTDRYGVGTFIGTPQVGALSNRMIKNNLATWDVLTVTLQGDEDHIIMAISSTSQNQLPEWLQIEEGTNATFYVSPDSLSIPLDSQPAKIKKGNVVWFGDSMSELRELPHRVERLTNYNVYDVSFAGSVLSHHSLADYKALGFRSLVQAIVSGDYTAQEQAVTNLSGANQSDKLPNFNTLKSIDWSTIDKAVVFIGTNDFGAGIPIGDGSNIGDSTQFRSSMKWAIEQLQTAHPHVELYFITPIYRGNWNTPNSQGKTLNDYVEAMVDVSKEYQLSVYNLFDTSGINKLTKSLYLMDDELHQTIEGDILLADKTSKFIESN